MLEFTRIIWELIMFRWNIIDILWIPFKKIGVLKNKDSPVQIWLF